MPTYVSRNITKKYTAAGAIDPSANRVNLAGAGAIAMTLVDPPNTPSFQGKTMTIVATTAQAHTVTNTTGFNAAGTGGDVATFGGAKGDSMTLVSWGGVWYTEGGLRNVTLA